MSLSFGRESFTNGLAQGRSLAVRDYAEMIPYKAAVPHEVDEARYVELDRSGLLRCYASRRNGKLVGYCIYVVAAGSLHSKSTKRASNTDWWLMPEERKGFSGIRLLDFAEQDLRDEGVVIMGTSVMETSKAARRILEFRGHRLTEVTYTKLLQTADA